MERHPTTPGEMLWKIYLEPKKLTIEAFAHRVGLTPKYIIDLIAGRERVHMHTAIRFAENLGTSPTFWLNAQKAVDEFREAHPDFLNETS